MATVIDHPLPTGREITGASDRSVHQETWAASRFNVQRPDKLLMAQHFAEHDFLLQPGTNPSRSRENTASLLVNGGTGPNMVLEACLKWIEEHATEGPFHLTWYSPGALVPATLYDFPSEESGLEAPPRTCICSPVRLTSKSRPRLRPRLRTTPVSSRGSFPT